MKPIFALIATVMMLRHDGHRHGDMQSGWQPTIEPRYGTGDDVLGAGLHKWPECAINGAERANLGRHAFRYQSERQIRDPFFYSIQRSFRPAPWPSFCLSPEQPG
jgi:hypothetical protein